MTRRRILEMLSLRRWGRDLWLPVVFLLLGLLVTVVAVLQTQRFVTREWQSQFDAQVTRMRNDLALHTYRHVDTLRTYHAEFAAHPQFSRIAFERITRVLNLATNRPGIDHLGYITMVSPGGLDLPAPAYQVHPLYPQTPASVVSENEPAGDAHVVEDAIRLEAIHRARDTGAIAATAPIGDLERALGARPFMVYQPLYQGGLIPASVEERRAQFVGAVFVALHPTRLMDTLFHRQLMPDVQVQLHFEDYTVAPPLGVQAGKVYDNHEGSDPATAVDRVRVPLTLAGTRWALDVGRYTRSIAASQRWLPWAVLGVGSLLSVLSALALNILQRSRRRSQILAERASSRRREAEAALHLRQRAIEASANAIVITSAKPPHYPVEYVNPAFERMTGYAAHEVMGRSLRILHGADIGQKGLQELQSFIIEQREGQTTLRNYRKNGEMFWTRIHVAPVKDDLGEVTHFVAAKYDVTQTHQYQETLEFQAWHDALTQLPNRHLLRQRLEESIQAARTSGRVFWVAFLDLNNFNLVNDTVGHEMGDQMLQQVAKRLQQTLHEDDIVARRGGDEFVFIIFDDPAPRNAQATLRRIMSAISRPIKLASHNFFLTCSIGIAVHPEDGDDPETLIKHADMAMYYAMRRGRNNYHFFSAELHRQALERVQLEHDLVVPEKSS